MVEERAHTKPGAPRNNLEPAARNLIPLSRFPQGKAWAGKVPPTPRMLRASPPRWHASMQRLPPQEGFQSALLKPPLRYPPGVPALDRRLRCARDREKKIEDGRHVGLDFYDLLIEAA